MLAREAVAAAVKHYYGVGYHGTQWLPGGRCVEEWEPEREITYLLAGAGYLQSETLN